MKKRYIHNILIGAALLLLSGCQTAEDTFGLTDPTENANELAGSLVQIDASSVALPEVGTRATATNFPMTGSTMTVGMKKAEESAFTYANYTYNGTAWKADATEGNVALRWEDNPVQEYTFIAVSPARDMSDLNFTLPTAYSQENVEAYEGLLTTTEVMTTKPANSIALSLKHPLVKITILSTAETITLKGQNLKGVFSGETGALTKTEDTANSSISMYKNGVVFTGYIFPRTTAEELYYNSLGENKFPTEKDMVAGDNYLCSEGVALITSTPGGLAAELAKNANAKILYINGEVNEVDLKSLKAYKDQIEELYIDAVGTETLNDDQSKENVNAFFRYSKLKKATLYRTTNLGKNAFRECPALQTVNLPQVEQISSMSVFEKCSNLTEVEMPNLVTVAATGAGWTFNFCTSLETIYLPKLENVGSAGMFSGCTSLKTAVMPKLEVTQGQMFQNCAALTTLVLKKNGKAVQSFNGTAKIPALYLVDKVYENATDLEAGIKAWSHSDYTDKWKEAHCGYTPVEQTYESLIDLNNYAVSATWSVD